MIKWIRNWYDYRLIRNRLFKGKVLTYSFKIAESVFNSHFDVVEVRCRNEVKGLEKKYELELLSNWAVEYSGSDFVDGLRTVKLMVWLKQDEK